MQDPHKGPGCCTWLLLAAGLQAPHTLLVRAALMLHAGVLSKSRLRVLQALHMHSDKQLDNAHPSGLTGMDLRAPPQG